MRNLFGKGLLASSSGLCTSELLVFSGIEAIPSFLKYYFLSQEFINIVGSSTYGSNLIFPIPGNKEQLLIIDFVKQETQKRE